MLGLSGPNPSSWSTRACTVWHLPSSPILAPASTNHATTTKPTPGPLYVPFCEKEKSCLEDSSSAFGRAGSLLLSILHLKATSSEITTDSSLKVKTPFFTQFLSIPPSNFFSTMYHNQQSSCSSFVFHENVNSTEAGTSGLRINCYISPVLVHS